MREYYFDWGEREPATWTIERVAGEPETTASFTDHLGEALKLTEQSLAYWADYMHSARARQEDNTFGSKVDVPRGLQISQFLFCFYDLEPDEALLVETETPDARYWSFQLYGLQYFRPFDIGRPTSLNHRQMARVDDRVQVVVAHRDPGVPNWLDTSGRRAAAAQLPSFLGSPAAEPADPGRAGRRRARRPAAGHADHQHAAA